MLRQSRSALRKRRAGARLGVTRVLEAARRWNVDVVSEAVRVTPELGLATDRFGRTALHLCAMGVSATAGRSSTAAIATARVLLKAGARLDAVHEIPDQGERFPATPLWYAIARGKNRALARFFLKNKANPNYCLWAVVWNDDVAMARALTTHGATVDLTIHGETPLLYATRLRRTRMVRWLLRSGADPNVADARGRTPLLYAVQRRYSEAEVEELLRHGADPHHVAEDGKSAIDLAPAGAHGTLGQLLARYVRGAGAKGSP